MKPSDIRLHRHIAALNAAFADAGFRAVLQLGGDSYRKATADIPDYHIYSPLDDQFKQMREGEMLWVGLEDARGRLVAIEAGRLVVAPKKRGGLNRIFNDRVFGYALPVLSRLPPVNLTGRLAYLGGAWTSPKLRGRRIMSLLVKLTVAHLVRAYGVEAVFGFVRSGHVGLALAAEGYGFTSAHTVDLMYLPGESQAETLCMVYTDPGILAERWQAAPAYRVEKSAERRSVKRRDTRG